jgi:hypothetical protein
MELMMQTSNELCSYFGPPLIGDEAKTVVTNFRKSFRKPMIRSNPNTHGPIWTQFLGDAEWTDTRILDDLSFCSCFLFWDERKNSLLFKMNTSNFSNYLNNRLARSYPPVYIFNEELTCCICQNGDDFLVRPVKLIKTEIITN